MDLIASGNIRDRSTLMWSLRRHFAFLVRHLTLRRAWNCALCVAEMVAKRAVLRSHPFYLRVAVADTCNLRCPGCLLGQEPSARILPGATLALPIKADQDKCDAPSVPKPLMPFDLFVKSVTPLLPFLLKVNLYDQGEPLLNPDLPRMISFLRYHNISSCVSSNFSLRLSDEKLTALLLSGLEHLIVAIDGVTPESYKMYRKRGDLELVLSNIRRLVALRERLGITSLVLDLQFIEFEHNMNERSQALLLARELGADRHTVIQGSSLEGWIGNRFRGTEEERREAGCYQAWVSTHIDSEGAVKLCDYGNDHGMPAIGQAHECVSSAVRNNDFAVAVRGTFGNKNSHLKEWCRTCSLYRVAPHNGASLQDETQSANRLHQIDLRLGEPTGGVRPGNRRK